jgi:hypothetical protein
VRRIEEIASEIFHETFRRRNNGANTLQHIDLHELRVPEALAMVERAIQQIRNEWIIGNT